MDLASFLDVGTQILIWGTALFAANALYHLIKPLNRKIKP